MTFKYWIDSLAQFMSAGAQSLLNIIPTISGLANCSFVYDTFQTFVNRRCNPLKSGLRHLWIPLLLVSIGLTLLTAAWVLTNHRNTHQRYMGTIYAQDFGPTRVKWREGERERDADASPFDPSTKTQNYSRVQKWMYLIERCNKAWIVSRSHSWLVHCCKNWIKKSQ